MTQRPTIGALVSVRGQRWVVSDVEPCTDADIVELRAIRTAIDEATVRAYGWDDLFDELDHASTPSAGTRYTIVSRRAAGDLDRLLELSHERHAEEVPRACVTKGRAAP